MRILSKISEILFGVIVLTLVCLTTSAIFGWEITQYLAYTFFISWGVFFVIEIAKNRNYYSFLLVGLAIGAGGYTLACLTRNWLKQKLPLPYY